MSIENLHLHKISTTSAKYSPFYHINRNVSIVYLKKIFISSLGKWAPLPFYYKENQKSIAFTKTTQVTKCARVHTPGWSIVRRVARPKHCTSSPAIMSAIIVTHPGVAFGLWKNRPLTWGFATHKKKSRLKSSFDYGV